MYKTYVGKTFSSIKDPKTFSNQYYIYDPVKDTTTISC